MGAREVASVRGVDGPGGAGTVQQFPVQMRALTEEAARIVKETRIEFELAKPARDKSNPCYPESPS
jgi:hypothetical protein